MNGMLLAGVLLAGATASLGSGAIPPRRHVVEIRGMAFHPAVLEVHRGDTIVWVNRDFVPHTATAAPSAARRAARNPSWDTGRLAPEESGRYVPLGEGEVEYFCALHPPMRGRLIVR
jgi:plastocyanin